MTQQTFGVIVSTRSFFPAHLVKTAREEITAALAKLGIGYVMLSETDTPYGAVVTYEDAEKCAALFQKHRDEIGGILVILPNFGEELGVVEAVDRAALHVPVLVQACPDAPELMDMSHRRDAFCGKISVCNNLRQRGIPFSLTENHTVAIDSEAFMADLTRFAGVCRVVRGLDGARIAMLGARPIAFNTVRYSEKILQRHRISVQTVDLSEILAEAERMDDGARIASEIDAIRAYARVPEKIDGALLDKQARLCLALSDTVERLRCDASSVQCWDSLEHHYGCAACLAMSRMGDSGKPSACESDVTGALSMLAAQLAAGRAAALMDWNNNLGDAPDACVAQHCSNFPKSFFESEVELGSLDVLGSQLGAENCFGACKGRVAPGDMTFLRLTSDDTAGELRAYVGEGSFLVASIDTKGGVAECRVERLQELLRYICKNGFEHHVCFVRGHVADVLEEALRTYLHIDVYRHN